MSTPATPARTNPPGSNRAHEAPGTDTSRLAGLRTLADLDVRGKRVLLRSDLNVPLDNDSPDGRVRVADDSRIRAALATIEQLRADGASVVLMSHLGRPTGFDPALSLRPVADRLAELIGLPVTLAPTVVGDDVGRLARGLGPGEILLLENVRFEPGETANSPELAARLAGLADVYVNDAFGSAHRAHASTAGVAQLLPSAAGRLLEREVRTLDAILSAPRRPLVAVLGGAKVADKIGVVAQFLTIADTLCIGGAMAFPFLAAHGHDLGSSPCAPEDVDRARNLTAGAGHACRLELPIDLIIAPIAPGPAPRVSARVAGRFKVDARWTALDIGPRTAERFAREIAGAGTVFWNGPMGRFELDPFARGTAVVAQAIAATSAVTVVGGGETVQAMSALADPTTVTHICTGGGAMLEFLEGRTLPGVQVLLDPAGVA